MIDNTTGVDTGAGNILTTFGTAALMSLLNGLMRDGDASSGGLFDKIFDVFTGETGTDMIGAGGPLISISSQSYDDNYLLRTTRDSPTQGNAKVELIPTKATCSGEIL